MLRPAAEERFPEPISGSLSQYKEYEPRIDQQATWQYI